MTWIKAKREFFDAVKRGDTAEVDRLLKSEPRYKQAYYTMGQTGMHLAAGLGTAEMLMIFLENGWHVDTLDEFDSNTPPR